MNFILEQSQCEDMKPHKSVICINVKGLFHSACSNVYLRNYKNKPIVHSRFDSNFIRFHTSYFPYNGEKDITLV